VDAIAKAEAASKLRARLIFAKFDFMKIPRVSLKRRVVKASFMLNLEASIFLL